MKVEKLTEEKFVDAKIRHSQEMSDFFLKVREHLKSSIGKKSVIDIDGLKLDTHDRAFLIIELDRTLDRRAREESRYKEWKLKLKYQ